MSTKIEWCDETINPLQDMRKGKTGRGYHCTKVSPACDHCYAEGINRRFGNGYAFANTPVRFEVVHSEIEKCYGWKKPRRIFIQSMSDLFHCGVYDEQITEILDIVDDLPRHTFIILTKRVGRMRNYFDLLGFPCHAENLWCGVTAENQHCANKRISVLLEIPAAVRFVSAEPMLAPLNLLPWLPHKAGRREALDWVICGAETGAGKRPMDVYWARGLRDQCAATATPFFFKKDSKGKQILDGKAHHAMPELKQCGEGAG